MLSSIQSSTPMNFLMHSRSSYADKQKRSLLPSTKGFTWSDASTNPNNKIDVEINQQEQEKRKDSVVESDNESEISTSTNDDSTRSSGSVNTRCNDQQPSTDYASDSSSTISDVSHHGVRMEQQSNNNHQMTKKKSSVDAGPTKNFPLAYSIASHLQHLVFIGQQNENPTTIRKESPMKLANFILDMMMKIDQKMYDKEIDGLNVNRATDLSITILLGAVIFLERLPSGTLTKKNLFHAVAVTLGLSLKIMFDVHPSNTRMTKMSGICNVERYNEIESKICILVKCNFTLSEEMLLRTREKFSKCINQQ